MCESVTFKVSYCRVLHPNTHLRWFHQPSWVRAAPAGWHRCSLTSAPNAMKVRTSAPFSVAPPPCTEKERHWMAERQRRGKELLHVSFLPVRAAAVPFAALVATLHPLNQTWLVLHPSQRWRGRGTHRPPAAQRPGLPDQPKAHLQLPSILSYYLLQPWFCLWS